MMDKAEDLDEDKAEDKDDGQGVPILGDDREDDNGDVANNDANENEEDHELKFVKIPDDVKKLSVEKLRPVDHMDAVRMEQDGHVNKEFHKEMFLGDHEEFENERYVEAESKLKDIVYKWVNAWLIFHEHLIEMTIIFLSDECASYRFMDFDGMTWN